MNPTYLRALALAGACALASPAWATEPLRLDEAIQRALATHPALRAEAAQLDAVRARAEREALPTPYVVGGDLENALGTGELGGLRSAEATLRLTRALELGGKRQARRALGDAEIARQQGAVDAERLDIAGRVHARFLEVVADQQRLAYARERVQLAERTRREVASWVAAARNPESDLRAAEIAVAEAELEREGAEHELDTARMLLASLWGAARPDFDRAAGSLRELPAAPDFEALAQRIPATPAQRAAELEAAELAARRRVAQSTAVPDVNVSLGVRRLEAIDDQGLVMSVSVPLGTKARARLAVAEVDAQIAAVDARRLAQASDARQALFEKTQELRHARNEFEAIERRMLPKAEQALAFTRRGFDAGRFSFVALTQAQTTLFNLRERSVEAAARYHALLAEIERLTAALPDATP